MATEYGVIVKARPDTNGFDEELNKQLKGKKREIDIDVAVSEDAVRKLNNIDERFQKIKQKVQTGFKVRIEEDGTTKELTRQINNLKEKIESLGETESTDKLQKKLASLVTELNDYKNKGTEAFKVTQEFKDKLGETQKVVTYITKNGEILNSEVVESTKVLQDNSKAIEENINKELRQAQALEEKNRKLKESTILYEENTRVRNAQGQIVSSHITTNANDVTTKVETVEYEDKKGRKIQETTKFLLDEENQWKRTGRTSVKIIDDQVKKQDEINKKIEESRELQRKNEQKRAEASKKAIDDAIKESKALAEKNEKLKESTILYEENTRVKNAKGQIVSSHITENANGKREKTETVEYEDELGRKIQETTKYILDQNGEWLRNGQTSVKVIDDQVAKEKELEEQQRKATAELQKRITAVKTYKGKEKEVYDLRDKTIHKLQSEVKETTNANNEMTRVTATTDKFIDSQGMLNTKVTETTEKFEIVDGKLKKVGDTLEKTTTNVEKSKTGLNQLGQSFSDIIVKVAKFYLASLPIRAMQNAITSAIQAVKDFDSALTEFKKVSDLSGESLNRYTENLEQLGKLTARTRTEMVEMATEFKRSGFSDADSAILAQTASLYQNIADEELSASDASAVLISQMKAFRFEADEAVHVIDSINEVANRNAVSSGDIGRGLTQAGAALSTYGNTFEETIGLITAGTEIFQGRSQQVARGLNTVASRVAKNEKALQEYGVQIYDTNGDLKSTYDILKELSPEWEKMTKAEQVALGTTLAGVNQYKVFSAVMTNFKTAIKATDDALNSEGSALKENEKYMESIKARLQAVKNELQEMILKSNLDDLIKNVLKLAEAFLKFQNSVGGLKPLLVAISGVLITFNVDKIIVGFTKLQKLFSGDSFKNIKRIFDEITKAISALTKGQKVNIGVTQQQTSATQGAKVATDGTTISVEALQAALSALTLILTAVVMAYGAYKQSQEKIKQQSLDLLKENSDYIKSSNEIINSLNNENLTREELNKIVKDNLSEYSEEIGKIDDLNEARERAIQKIQEERKARADETLYGSTEIIKEAYKNLYGEEGTVNPNSGWYNALILNKSGKENVLMHSRQGRTAEETKKFYEDLQNQIKETGSASVKYFGVTYKFNEDNLKLIQKYWNEINDEINTNNETLEQANPILRELGLGIEKVDGEIKTIDLSKALNVGDEYYGSQTTQKIFQEIADAKEEWNLTDKQALEVKNHLSEYSYDVQKTVAGLFPDIVQKAQEAEDEINAFIDAFGLTADQVQAIRDKMAETGSDDFFSTAVEVYPELEDGINNYTEAMKEASEEEERSKELLNELGIKENALQKEIGMSSTELIRQADAWNINETALYNYLKALNQFDESLDNTQSAYGTLQTAIDEYNSMQGYSIDTMQALLRLSPEYLTMLDDELNGRKSLKDSITDKIKAQALEAKQEVYNMAIQRLQALTSKDSKNANDENASSFRNSVDDIDAQTEALNRNTKSIMQNSAFKSAVGAGKKKEAEQVVQEMQEQIDIIDKAMLSLGTDFSSAMGKGTSSTKGTNSALKEQNNLLKEQKQLLEEKKKQYDTVVAYIKKKIQDEIKKIEAEKKVQVDAIKEQIDALKDLKEEETNRIDEQIDKLKEQKEIEQTYWEEKIEAFKKQNEELEEQLEYEELLENLAKAKSKRVRVYKEGQGFVYTEDGNEVDKAQAEIDEYTRKKQYEDQLELLQSYKEKSEKNYEEQIKALEKLKDEKEKNYDEQIKALENHQKEIEAAYDAQIAYFQGYLDKFTEQTDAYENETNRQLAIQLTGIDFEQQGWQKRLDNLANFVEKYNALLGDIHTLDTGGSVDTSSSGGSGSGGYSGGSGSGSGSGSSGSGSNKTLQANINSAVKSGMPTSAARSYGIAMTAEKKDADWYAKNYGGRRPSGDSSISEDGIYLVGDSPNQELVIGSKLNGSLMSLSEGSGVVNATSTRTLAGILNQLGLAGNQGINMSNSQNKSTNIQIGNISLPSVQNGKDFVDYLQNFSLQMTQEAFA